MDPLDAIWWQCKQILDALNVDRSRIAEILGLPIHPPKYGEETENIPIKRLLRMTSTAAWWNPERRRLEEFKLHDNITELMGLPNHPLRYKEDVGDVPLERFLSIIKVDLSCTGTLVHIRDNIFRYLDSLEEVIFNPMTRTIGSWSFCGCSRLSHVYVPGEVTSIGRHAFSRCSLLSVAYLPHALRSLGEDAFSSCSSLMDVNIPPRLSSIPARAFFDCFSLVGVRFPDGLTSIDKDAFHGCRSMTYLIFPKTLETLEKGAFAECLSLRGVYFPGALIRRVHRRFRGCHLAVVVFAAALTRKERDIREIWFQNRMCSECATVLIGNGIVFPTEADWHLLGRLSCSLLDE